jgi:phosphoribosylamine---glycine ligase
MRVLVVGSGGREHALAWKLARSASVSEVVCAPGNPGMAEIGPIYDVSVVDFDGLAELARRERIDLTVVGPEIPLCNGIADLFRAQGLRVFGPSRASAQLEGSKSFAKGLMTKAGIPTAGYKVVDSMASAESWLSGEVNYPVVVKASGLAAGKGVVVAQDSKEALDTLKSFLVERTLGDAAAKVVIEEFLPGEEVSQLCITDGRDLVLLPAAQDHKRVFDGDQGPNTGGMGALSPAPVMTEALSRRVEREILVPAVHALAMQGMRFSGLLYAGLMVARGVPKVLEFNVRFGDPETQVIVPRLSGDFGELLSACVDGHVLAAAPSASAVDPRAAVSVVLTAGGYPGSYQRGHPIEGIEEASRLKDVIVFHAGTARRNGRLVTNGGRVLNVTALGDSLQAAVERAYEAVGMIKFEGMHARRDIAARALAGSPGARK